MLLSQLSRRDRKIETEKERKEGRKERRSGEGGRKRGWKEGGERKKE